MNPATPDPRRPGPLWIVAALTLTGLALLVWATGIFATPGPAATAPSSIAATTPTTPTPSRGPSPDEPGEWAASIPTDQPAHPTPSAHSQHPRPSAATGPANPGGQPMDSGETPDPADAPAGAEQRIGVDPGSRTAQQAVTIAERFATAYAAPTGGVTAARWWAAVDALLSEQAAADYAGADPAQVPWTRRTGPGRLVPLGDGSTPVVAVQVPTNAGKVTVHLVPDTRRGWVVTRVQMPAGTR